jgi:hypothetical protein
MARRAQVAAAAVIIAILATGTALAGTVNGTWRGRMLDPQLTGSDVPAPERAPIRDFAVATVIVKSSSAMMSSTGVTMATHDSPTAVSTCAMRFRFALAEDGWRVYRQLGPMKLSGAVSGGAPALSACAPRGGALRVRPAGAKLKAEFVGTYRPSEGAANFDGWPLRGYLTR